MSVEKIFWVDPYLTEKIGANITESKARVDFVWEGNISEKFDVLLNEANRLIQANFVLFITHYI